MLSSAFACLLLAAGLGQADSSDPARATAVHLEPFQLQDARGAWHSLDEAREASAVVIAFLGAECPLSDLYASRLAELAKAFEPRKVAFFGVDANAQDGPSALGRFTEAHHLPFPLLKDVGNELADRLGAERTPEVFVFDADRVLRYRGRVDDQFGLGVHRPGPRSRDLADALGALLAGKPVAHPRTQAAGCLIGRRQAPSAKLDVTYARQVARILRDRCVACHRPGEIAPFSLNGYKQAAGWAEMIAEVVRDGRMPPWHASPAYGHFANEARLSADEKKVILDWVNAGAPEGDPRDLPEPIAYPDGWRIPKPDLVLSMHEAVEIPAGGKMPYQYFVVDPKLDHDVWVGASQIRPGNPSVVHHVVLFVLRPGSRGVDSDSELLAAYAPGMPPRVLRTGTAKLLPAGSRLLFQLHYTPRGTPQTDRTQVGLVFADPKTVRKRVLSTLAANPRLRIPPAAADFASAAEFRCGQDYVLYALMPHMHLRGKSFRFEAVFSDGKREVLLDVPRYEFDWQNVYVLSEPRELPEGTVVRCLARFDNSADNPNNPDPKRVVHWGEQTNDEMLVGYMEMALGKQDLSLPPPSVEKLAEGRYEVTFRYRAPAGTKAVFLAGTFNEWNTSKQPMTGPDDEGRFTTKLVLDGGHHEYKFVLEGKTWRHDPSNPRQAGIYNNSVLEVGKAP